MVRGSDIDRLLSHAGLHAVGHLQMAYRPNLLSLSVIDPLRFVAREIICTK